MISKQAVDDQLKRIGVNFRFWGRSEVNELGRILMEDEIIAECVNGEYSNGFAMLVSTNHRLLLVDKKPLLYLTVEDYRYEMITEFNLNNRLLNAEINIHTASKTMNFKSWNQHRLRRLLEYVQARVLEMRQQQHFSSQFSAAAAAQFAKAYAAQTQAQMSGQQLDAPDTLALLEQPSAAHVLPATSQPKESPATPAPTEPRLASVAARISHGRSALGTYTRNKLPSFRRLSLPGSTGASETRPAPESGEVFQEGYRPAPSAVNGIGRFGIRYDFES